MYKNGVEDNVCAICYSVDKQIYSNGDTTIYICEECGTTQLFVDEMVSLTVKRETRNENEKILVELLK